VPDPDIIPLADELEPFGAISVQTDNNATDRSGLENRPTFFFWSLDWFAPVLLLTVATLHGIAIWIGLGGYPGLTNGWPLWRDDHPLYYHSALVTRDFLRSTGTTAGYDPSFMAGYPKSVVFPASSTLPELVVAALGGTQPEFAYKLYVLYAGAALPWLVVWACQLWRISASGIAAAVILTLLYVWTDFPLNYVSFGMLPYFLGVPLGLVATGAFSRYLTGGGISRWLSATLLLSLAVLVHFTTAMVVAPAAAIAYAAAAILWSEPRQTADQPANGKALRRPPPAPRFRKFGWPTHLAIWLIPAVVLGLNAFWWYPGIWLAQTKGDSSFAFAHPEGVWKRLVQIVSYETPPIESVLLALGIPGLYVLLRQQRVQGCALLGFCLFGLFWGYLAGNWRELDFLQPGRHTYALYLGLAVASGASCAELIGRLRGAGQSADRLDRWLLAGILFFTLRIFAYPLAESVRIRIWAGEPFLSSRPSARLEWVLDRVTKHLKKGERLLYEEGGIDLPGIPDPFHHGRFSGLIPERTGVEVIGGPYLHAALKTNFTQFGEGKLFGRADWDRDFFVRYARLYRPSAILCWSPHARRFCQDSRNRDLIEILDDDGTLLIARVVGFAGDTIKGAAHVQTNGGRLEVHDLAPDLDGTVVLRYHFVPYLRTIPRVACEPVYLEDDPVPFIQLRPPAGIAKVDLELHLPPPR
jgi:hypothetical protein